jgi:hypothetical protein
VVYPAAVGRRGAIACALVALLGSLAAVPSASAASIAFIGNGDLLLSSPDGSKVRRVADVAEAAPLRSPSVAPDGTIWVVAGALLVRLAPTGAVISAIAPAVAGTPTDVAVSPDGLLLAYTVIDAAGGRVTAYTRADGTGGEADFGTAVGLGNPSFIDATRVVLDNAAGAVLVDTVQPGATPAVPWFADAATKPTDGAVNPVLQVGAWVGADSDGSTVMGLYPTLGGPPSAPTRACRFGSPGANDPDWSSDGAAVTWADDTGVWVASVPAVPTQGTCTSLTASRITAAGAREPDWSPLDVPAGPNVSADGKPRVAGLALSAAAFPAATGTTLSFATTSAGTATVVAQRVSTGVRKKRGCVAGATRRKLQRCTRREVVGAAFQQAVPAGAVSLPVLRPDLTPGKYELVVTLTDAVGRSAAPKRIRITVQ